MIALLAKPCLGLIEGQPDALKLPPQLAGPAYTLLMDEPGEPCAKLCLNARLEDAQAVPGRLNSSLPTAPLAIPAREDWQPERLLKAGGLPLSTPDNVRTRLAMLNRLLL